MDDLVKRLRDKVAASRIYDDDEELLDEAASRIEMLEEHWRGKMTEEQLSPAQYWEAQASMWHENYKEAMAHEEEARRYKVALERIRDSGYGTKERIRLIIMKALGEKKDVRF